MCGRTRLSVPPGDLADVFDATLSPGAADPNAAVNLNCAPTDPILIVRRAKDSDVRELVAVRWGLVPFYIHDFRDCKPMINARVETVATSRAFRDSFKKRRCLVLADGFYEWRHEGKKKLPHVIQRKDHRPFGLAGIWDRWKGVLHGKQERIETCAVITRTPTTDVAAIHDRMPLVLDEKDHAAWLDPATNLPTLHDILDHRYVKDWIIEPITTMPESSRKRQMPLFT